MRMNRGRKSDIFQAAATVAVLSFVVIPDIAHSQDYPSRPIKIIVPNGAGGSSDIAARILSDHLSKVWNQPVVVENKPGGNTAIGISAVVHSAADGYTLLLGTPSLSTFKIYLKSPEFDVGKDLAPISQLMVSPYVIAVSAKLPASNIAELIDLAKKNPGKLNYGSYGGGQILATESFKKMAGIDLVRVPYQGEAPAMTGLASNDVQVVFATAVTSRPMMESGTVRALAVSTATRWPSMPSVPTVAESGGPNYVADLWFGLLAPANTPSEIRQKLAKEVAAFTTKPEVIDRFLQLGFTPTASTPDEFGRLISEETQRWIEVARFASIVPQ
jgi:tripartite-type tricarboxylate transporter receptor subunit TctC